MRNIAKSAIAAALVGLFAGAAIAQSTMAPADVIKARQANYKKIGGDAKAIGDELKLDKPDVAKLKASVADLKTLAAALPTWFPAGSGPEAGVKTAAKPEIWSDAAGFATAAKNLADATTKLDQLAQAGDVSGMQAQMKNVGMACGGCHTKYRVKQP